MAKPLEKQKARTFRKKGLSIKTIAKQLKVSKGTVSIWCQDITLTIQQRKLLNTSQLKGQEKGRTIASLNRVKERQLRQFHYGSIGKKMIGKLSKRDLLLIGTALYWAEGTKKGRRTILCNSDPYLIQLYTKWLTEILEVEPSRLKCYVGINVMHQYRIDEVINYWVKITGIKQENFTKTSFKKVANIKTYENTSSHYGTLSIAVKAGTNLQYQILGQINALKKHVANVAQG